MRIPLVRGCRCILASLNREESVQQARRIAIQPEVVRIMDQRPELSSVMSESAWDCGIPSGFGGRRPLEVCVMRFPGSGRRSHHDITSKTSSVRSVRNEVSSFGLAFTCVYELLRRSLPRRLPAQRNPGIANAIVAAEAGSLGARQRVSTVWTELLVASTARGERGILTSLAGMEYREAHVFPKGKSERSSLEKRVWGGSIPRHVDPSQPCPGEVRRGLGRQPRRVQAKDR